MDNNEDDLLSLDSDSGVSEVKEKRKKSLSRSSKKPTVKAQKTCNFPNSDAHDDPAQGSSNGHFSGGIAVMDSESESDNETELRALPREASQNTSSSGYNSTEITLSDDDDDTNAMEGGAAQETEESQETSENERTSGYGLRRKRKVNYTEMENAGDLDDNGVVDKINRKKEIFDIFAFPDSKIAKFIQKPELVDNFTNCKIVFMDGTGSSKINLVEKFFEKCGHQFESFFVQTRYDEENFIFLKNVFRSSTAIGKLHYRYQNRDDALLLLKLLKSLRNHQHLPSLHTLNLASTSGQESLAEEHIAVLADIQINFQSIEVGDYLWEDVKTTSLEKLLDKQKSSLESLIIHGGFRGEHNTGRKLIVFPKMEKLATLYICPSYTFLSEIKNPHSKKARMITIGMNKREEPFKIAIKFSTDIPTLRQVVLGNLIEVEDLLFSSIRKLDEFRCGSYWNLTIKFPPDGSRKALLESNVSELQFPDALKDPSFTVKVAKHFPNLKKVWMFLPSVPVLRAFFKAFENSNLEELYLKTQFDFESTMESCLLPRMSDIRKTSKATETILNTLKEYKHFDEYVRYHNVELPVTEEDLMEGHSEGIRTLKKLKVLHLEHIPRKLLIPIPDDERKWYDHHCKFMNTTFGYERYPLNYRCHTEILKLDLSEYIWKNIQIDSDFTDEFYQAGFVDIPDVQLIREVGGFRSNNNRHYEEDLFIPIRAQCSSGAQLKIMPSMLFPDVKIKPEET